MEEHRSVFELRRRNRLDSPDPSFAALSFRAAAAPHVTACLGQHGTSPRDTRVRLAGSSAALKKLHSAFVPLRRSAAREGAKISPLAGARIGLPRIQPVLSRLQLAYHGKAPRECRPVQSYFNLPNGL